jgi:hypothetical protein
MGGVKLRGESACDLSIASLSDLLSNYSVIFSRLGRILCCTINANANVLCGGMEINMKEAEEENVPERDEASKWFDKLMKTYHEQGKSHGLHDTFGRQLERLLRESCPDSGEKITNPDIGERNASVESGGDESQ